MKSKSVAGVEERTFVLILDQGEEAFKAITDFANKQGISGASVSAVGAFAEAKVGWFDLQADRRRRTMRGSQPDWRRCGERRRQGEPAPSRGARAARRLCAGRAFSLRLGAADP
jgi:hypothetical protein